MNLTTDWLAHSLLRSAERAGGCYVASEMGMGERIRREHFASDAIYGTVVYLTILVLLEEDRTRPEDAAGILLSTALVLWLAHIYARLFPRITAEGRLRTSLFVQSAEDQVGILAAAAIPMIPLVLATLGLLEDRALRAAIAADVLSLAAFSLRGAREAGLGWGRSLALATVLLAAGVGLLWLEVSLH